MMNSFELALVTLLLFAIVVAVGLHQVVTAMQPILRALGSA